MSTLRATFLEELAEVYAAEKQLIQALPKLAKAARHEQLRRCFEEHLEQTEEQVTRLEHVFEVLDESVERKACKAMSGLLHEAEHHIEHKSGDAALICAAQKVEHYELAAYGCLHSWARLLGEEDAADLLEETLEEERAADEKLTETAEDILHVEDPSAETYSKKERSK